MHYIFYIFLYAPIHFQYISIYFYTSLYIFQYSMFPYSRIAYRQCVCQKTQSFLRARSLYELWFNLWVDIQIYIHIILSYMDMLHTCIQYHIHIYTYIHIYKYISSSAASWMTPQVGADPKPAHTPRSAHGWYRNGSPLSPRAAPALRAGHKRSVPGTIKGQAMCGVTRASTANGTPWSKLQL
jgi:hypothetical protein